MREGTERSKGRSGDKGAEEKREECLNLFSLVYIFIYLLQPPDAVQLKEIENEVNRLLKPADNESIEILNADEYLITTSLLLLLLSSPPLYVFSSSSSSYLM